MLVTTDNFTWCRNSKGHAVAKLGDPLNEFDSRLCNRNFSFT